MNETPATVFGLAPSADVDCAIRLKQRRALTLSLFGWVSLIAACGGGGGPETPQSAPTPAPAPPAPTPSAPPAPAPSPAPPEAWSIGLLYFAVGSGAVHDLTASLPSSIKMGGVFGISSSGTPLPAGMTLSPPGILAVGTATVGDVTGVVFTYSEPGT